MLFAALFCSAAEATVEQNTLIVRHQQTWNLQNIRHLFSTELLKLILSKADVEVQLQPYPVSATYSRKRRLIQDGVIDVSWQGSKPPGERAKYLREVPYPIFKGLLGYRLVLLHKDNKDLLRISQNAASLENLIIGQGQYWPDVSIYQSNDLQVMTATGFQSLFNMLNAKRIDLLPRSVIEVWYDFDDSTRTDVIIDQHVAIRYPYAMVYVVDVNNTRLFDYIEEGFKKVLESGEYDQLFKLHMTEFIDRANLSARTIIDLDNPKYHVSAEDQAKYYFTFD